MLVLTRKPGEAIQIGDSVSLTILEIRGNQVKVGIEAPDDVTVYREELFRIVREQNTRAAAFVDPGRIPPDLPDLAKLEVRLKDVSGKEES